MKVIYIFLILFLSALIGTAIGEILLLLIPQNAPYYSFFSSRIVPLWSIETIDLVILNFSFTIQFNINPLTLIGLIVGSIFSLKKV